MEKIYFFEFSNGFKLENTGALVGDIWSLNLNLAIIFFKLFLVE